MQDVRMLILVLLIALLSFTGLVTAIQTDGVFAESETIKPPANLSIGVQVDQVGKSVIVTFRGGFGQTLLKDLNISVISPDGTKETKSLGFKVGDSVTFTGTGCGDQVTGTATYMNGIMYPFLYHKMPVLNSYCNLKKTAVDPCDEISSSPSLVTENVTDIPANRSVAIQANVDIQRIDVEFRGGFGQNLIKNLEVTRHSPDGTEEKKILDNRTGSTASFNASNGCKERISADVTFLDGTTYHFFDKVIPISRNH